MKIMGFTTKILVGWIFAAGLTAGAHAESGGIAWDKVPNHQNDLTSLQNGAKLFVSPSAGDVRVINAVTIAQEDA